MDGGREDLDFWKLSSVSGLLELDMSQSETEHSGIPSEQDEALWASRGTGLLDGWGQDVGRSRHDGEDATPGACAFSGCGCNLQVHKCNV